MTGRQIIMNFSVPPSADDLHVIASTILETLPPDILEFVEGLAVNIEELTDEAIQAELEIDDVFELLALFRSGKEIAPGIERKTANDDDVLILYRRPILDMWCENQEDLNVIVRQVVIEEIARNFDFSDDEIDDMIEQHHQSML